MNAAPTGTLIHLDPATIATDKNIRTDLQITPEWVKNLKQNGVLQPISAYWDDVLEHYQVEAGHRRTVGAAQAGLATIPVYVVDKPAEDADRIVGQVVENIQRAALHQAEEASAYRQLSFAMPATMVAKRTGTGFARVGDAIRVAKNPVAEKALEQHQLTIEDALVFDEFSDDEAAIASLTKTVTEKPEQLAHTAERLRVARRTEQLEQELRADLAARNIPVTDDRPSYDDPKNQRLRAVYTDPERQTPAELDSIPADHLVAGIDSGVRWDNGTQVPYAEPVYIVIDYPAIGLHAYASTTGAAKGPLTADEKAARALARENNKLWAPATTVRLAWVKKLLERRALPQDAPALAALWFSQMRTSASSGRAGKIAHELLGLKMSGSGVYNADTRVLEQFVKDSANQGMHVLIAVAVGSIEGCLDEKSGWQGMYPTGMLALYLKQLAAWGYTLSDIEQGIVDSSTPKTKKSAA